jgi:putative methyltransferase (TIGR04325 family)
MLKDLLPPSLVRLAIRQPISWTGDHPDWRHAAKSCGGYGDRELHDRIELSAREVIAGRAAYERDGVCFATPAAHWPILAACLLARPRDGDGAVLDFGGSFASAWLQHRGLLGNIRWAVVEQPLLVERGRQLFPAGNPGFHINIADAVAAVGRPDLAILSAVLSWIEQPEAVVRGIVSSGPRMILIDRTGVCDRSRDRITIQRCHPPLPPSSYPCRFFAPDRIPALLAPAYRLISEVRCDDACSLRGARFQGWLFERRP